MNRRIKPDWFLISLAVAVLLAIAFPDAGAEGGWMHPELLTKGGVSLIFFLHGVALPFERLKAGTLQWPLHLVVQLCTFGLFPLLGAALYFATKGVVHDELRVGLFFLCALPSTVSSSVAMTAAARGNVAASVFNATLSSLLGIFLTPFWLALVLKSSGAGLPLGKVIVDLLLWLALPLAIGQVARFRLAGWASRNKTLIGFADRATIALLVYTSFCDSVKEGLWKSQSPWALFGTFAISVVLFVLVFWCMKGVSRALRFPFEDEVTAVFCGSKRTLASGVPMAKLIFGAGGGLGLILLPIMIYHAMQLVVCAWLAERWSQRSDGALRHGVAEA